MCSRLFIPFAWLAEKIIVQIMFQVAMPAAMTVMRICAYMVPELNGEVPHGPHPNKRVNYLNDLSYLFSISQKEMPVTHASPFFGWGQRGY